MGRKITYSSKNIEPAPLSTSQAVKGAAIAAARFAASGFETTSKEERMRRSSICLSCEHWKHSNKVGVMRCDLCKCTRLMWKIASKSCPIGKW